MEILRSNGSYWCSLPDLPDDRSGHTQSGLIACGGHGRRDSDIMSSCSSFSNGEWIKSHQLSVAPQFQYGRFDHSSWISPQGVVLMGGLFGAITTENLTDDGLSIPSFPLKYKIR